MEKQKTRRYVGMFTKVLSGYVLIILVVMLTTSIITYNLVHSYIFSRTRQELLQKVEFIASGEYRSPDWEVLRKYQNLLDAEILYVNTDYTATKLHTSGSTLLDQNKTAPTDLQYTSIVSGMDQKIIGSIFAGNHETGVEQVDFLTERIVYAGVPVLNEAGETVGALMLIRLVKDVDVFWLKVLAYIAIAVVCALVLAIFFATIFARTITKPIKVMNNAAKSLAAGDYSVHVPVQNDEIGQLAETINVLAERLGQVICHLENEKSRIEKIVYSIAEGVVAFDAESKVIRTNRTALELMEICNWEKCNGPEAQARKQHVLELIAVCQKTRCTEHSTWTNPSERAITATASPIVNTDQQVIGAVCLLRDVSEEQRLEQLRREYIANVSHELRTPLTGIRGMVEPLIDGVLETEEEKNDNYRIIYKETLRLEKLIGEMLDLSRLQDGRVKVELEPVELTNTVHRAVSSMRKLADEAKIVMNVCTEEEVLCMGNEDRIVQTLVILIDNAVSFTPEGGTVTVSVRSDDEKVYVSVKDTGAGIEPQHVPYIWERFYKADRSRMRTKGTGLGLAIAKRVVELMNGEITVQTELGKGAEFTFTMQKVRN